MWSVWLLPKYDKSNLTGALQWTNHFACIFSNDLYVWVTLKVRCKFEAQLTRHGASLRGHPYIVTDRNRFILLLRYIKHSTNFYDDIANNAGSHANSETLTWNSETLRADIYWVGLRMLNTKGLNLRGGIAQLFHLCKGNKWIHALIL